MHLELPIASIVFGTAASQGGCVSCRRSKDAKKKSFKDGLKQ